jgi:4-hydroxy-3-methylbut-2-enyl diphosphate reductase
LKKIIIAEHYGFCMGVKRAIAIAEETMRRDPRVTIFNEIVHNEAIVEKFRRAGVGQSSSMLDIDGGTVIIPAHGASPKVFRAAAEKGLRIVDATCPLVIRIHKIIDRLAKDGYQILHFGDPAHDETIGIVGHAPDKVIVVPNKETFHNLPLLTGKLALTSQTTTRVSDFVEVEKEVKNKYPEIVVFNTICNATNQRQLAILELARKVDLILVVGSQSSANSKRLAQISQSVCGRAYLINNAEDIREEWFNGSGKPIEVVGLSAGASTPDFLIEAAIIRLKEIARNPIEVFYPAQRETQNRLVLEDSDK